MSDNEKIITAPNIRSWRIGYGLCAALFLFLINTGYLNLALHAKPGFRYTGANLYAAADKLVYMSMIQQGREGILFMKNLHTTDPQVGLLLSPHWYLIGQTAGFLQVSNNAAYQGYRILFALLFIGLLYYILVTLFTKVRDRLVAASLVLFSSGLGWFFMAIHPSLISFGNTQQKYLMTPTDIYVTEGNTLLNFSQSPLFAVSQFLMLLSLVLFIANRQRRAISLDMGNALLMCILIIMHPYDLPIMAFVLGSWSVWYTVRTGSFSPLYRFAVVMAGGGVALAYHFYSAYADPVLAEWLKQNLVYSPPVKNYLWGYGALLPLWLIGLVVVLRHRRDNVWWMMLLIWSAGIWTLLYLPIDLNRRFTNGFHIPLALVATEGLLWLYAQCRRLWLKLSAVLLTSVMLFGSIGLFLFVNLYFSPSVYSYGYYYITDDEQRVIDYLKANSTAADALMPSDQILSFTLTSQINRTVFRGHEHQTPRALERQQQLDWFFADQDTTTSVARKREFLGKEGIDFVILDGPRLEWTPQWIGSAPFLREVFRSGFLIVYRVAP